MSKLMVYERRTCSTCRKLVQLLESRGIGFDRLDYHVNPLSEERIRTLLTKAKLRPRDILRTKEPVYAELGLAERDVDDDELIRLMATHPQLIQRPIVELGDHAVLARPADRVLELLDESGLEQPGGHAVTPDA